ncbi:putative 4-amino-4-deoxy-L-arabinose-phosphoundecaprenol flippase subunit ArnE [Camelimonas fluminis]|uniref:EamA family transporter n=1 Tax=Camelimonas fluminis TaxID=1576911 RepID=A0ABV7UGV4_9HYPH|nr:EamA family transporter [Camelimonas fluminis]GHE72654.1 putative 4-amino-4-deoxy-L-arabinose-phosphoundecaprenol flippase subunit ArnE [Camelimonas fluminis]
MNVATARAAGNRWRQGVIWLLFILLDTGAQLAFKWGADGLAGMDAGPAMLLHALTLPGVWLAVAGYVSVFFVWMAILRNMPLSRAFPMTGMTYITVPLLAWAVLGERISLAQACGVALIVSGVVLLGHGEEAGGENID